MPMTIAGKLIRGNNDPIAQATITLSATQNSNLDEGEVLQSSTFTSTTDVSGVYSIDVLNGQYDVSVKLPAGTVKIGEIVVTNDTPSPMDLIELIGLSADVSYNEAQQILLNAVAAKNNAHLWATEAEDVQVDDGVNPVGYSAFHFAKKAEAFAPMIDDTVTANNRTWSSDKIVSYVAETLTTEVPTLSASVISVNEFGTGQITIANYDAALTYIITSLNESVATASQTDGVITISGLSVDVDTLVEIRVQADAPGLPPSDYATISATVVNIPAVADDTYQVVDFTNESSSNTGWSLV